MLKEFTKRTNIYELFHRYIIILEYNKIRCNGFVSNIEVELSEGGSTLELYLSDGLSEITKITTIPAYCLGNTVHIYYGEKPSPHVYTGKFESNNLKGDNKMMIPEFSNNKYSADAVRAYAELCGVTYEDNRKAKSPNIIDHSFDGHKTTIKWSDNTTTTCYCKRDDADPYTGFYIACAKKFMGNGNKVNNLAEKWIDKIPKQRAKAKAKADEIVEREKRIEANKKKKREKNRIRLEAIKLKQEYEAKKLANEKYGVPMDFKAENKEG